MSPAEITQQLGLPALTTRTWVCVFNVPFRHLHPTL